MKSAILTPHEFARLVADASGIEATPTLRTSGAIAAGGKGRSIGFVFSDESVARDGHTIATRGWELTSFQANPVFLFGHDDRSPPVGRVTRIAKSGTQLVGTVEFADEATYPFADTIFRLFKGGFLNATSVSWLPLEWKHSSDKSRPYGIDFLRQELLEISAVPVPALPTALVTARAAGIDTKPLSEWAARMLDDERSAVPRDELETIRREARMPSAGTRSEETAVGSGQPAVGSDAEGAAGARVASGELRMEEATRYSPLAISSLRQRGLYHVAAMCDALEHCRYVHAQVCAEAAAEGDGSLIPDRMGAWLDEGHRICAAMAAEETQENIDGTQDERTASLVEAAVSRALRGLGLARAGKRLSAETERCLRAAHAHVTAAHKSLEDVLDPESDADPETGTGEGDDTQDGESDARALRARKAAALKRRVANSE